MSFELWREVPPETRVLQIGKTGLLVLRDDNQAFVATVHPAGNDAHGVLYAPVDRLDQLDQPLGGNTREQTIGAALRSVMGSGDFRILSIPPVAWGFRFFDMSMPGGWGVLSVAIGGAGVGFQMALMHPAMLLVHLPALGILLFFMVFFLRRRQPRTTRIVTPGMLELDGSNLVDYALARQRGEHPELPTDTQRRADIVARVEGITEEYGRLTSDLAYRIENSALFDASEPLTSEFLVLLGRYDNEAAAMPTDDLDDLAAELEISYATARDHAEAVGLGHLPVAHRADAHRAAKAARLAAETSSDGERAAALEQVRRILESLSLYYLPAELVRRAITDGRESP